MATKKGSDISGNNNINNNRNVNTNHNLNNTTVNNHIVFPESIVKQPEKKSNWLVKAIVTSIITIIVSLAIFYGKQSMNGKNNPNVATQGNSDPVIGTKQTKN